MQLCGIWIKEFSAGAKKNALIPFQASFPPWAEPGKQNKTEKSF
jgi:hypothetical protein